MLLSGNNGFAKSTVLCNALTLYRQSVSGGNKSLGAISVNVPTAIGVQRFTGHKKLSERLLV